MNNGAKIDQQCLDIYQTKNISNLLVLDLLITSGVTITNDFVTYAIEKSPISLIYLIEYKIIYCITCEMISFIILYI